MSACGWRKVLSSCPRAHPIHSEDLAQVAGGKINCARYVPGGQQLKLVRAVAASIGKVNVVPLANHGVVACGRHLVEAFVTLQIVKKGALLLLGSPWRTLPLIPGKFVREEHH